MKFRFFNLLLIIGCFLIPKLNAHPGGNLITAGDFVLWSYIYPLEDTQHHACVMIRDRESAPEPLLVSRYAGSDFFLYAQRDTMYYIETRNSQNSDQHYFRVLKGIAGEKPAEIWSWREDKWRVGRSGFYTTSENQIVFCRYPELYQIDRESRAKLILKPEIPVNSIRKLDDGNLLLLSDNSCRLLDENNRLLRLWNNITDSAVQSAPLNRNKIFDADYRDGLLLLAYWGNRSFLTIDLQGNKREILKLKPPFAAHWVALNGNEMFLFSSEIDPPNPIKPKFIRMRSGEMVNIWGEN